MILTQEGRSIERSGVRVERVSSIEADAVAFDVLSNILYPDKPLAIIRELSCNAADSHARAGKSHIPFEIHLPNVLEPYLSIRDFGTGMSFRDTSILLMTYFKSTKRGTNTETGALGLGSKTPFSYVDSYTIISRYNGRKFVFNAFKNEEGKPSSALLDRSKTTEENGIEFIVPVRASDFEVFRQKAEQVLEWFDVKPTITGNTHVDIHQSNYELEGTGWKIAKNDQRRYGYGGYSSNSLAIQGNIAYPIHSESLMPLPSGYAELLYQKIHFFFPIGSVGFTAGRDALSYDKTTIATVTQALDTFVKELPTKFQDKFDACTTLWEAKAVYGALVNGGTCGRIFQTLNRHKRLVFKALGQDIDSSVFQIDMKKYPNATITHKWRRTSSLRSATSYLTDVTVQAGDNTVIVVNNLEKGGVVRMQYEMRIRGRDSEKNYYFIQSADHADFPKLIEALGNPPVMYTADMPKPPRTARSVQKGMTQMFDNDWFEEPDDEISIEDGGLYMPTLKGYAVDKHGRRIERFSEMVQLARKMGILTDDDVIVGGIKRQIDKLVKAGGWKHAYDEIVERFKKHLETTKVLDEIAASDNYTRFRSSFGWNAHFINLLNLEKAKIKDPNSLILQFTEKFASHSHTTQYANERRLAGLLSIYLEANVVKPEFDFSEKWKEVCIQYKLLSMVSRPESQMAAMIEYINMVDAQKK